MLTPVFLSGGEGSRLWPLSRRTFPKQFSKILDKHSLFQANVECFSAKHYHKPVVMTTSDLRFIVSDQLNDIGTVPNKILVEPKACNTAPAILAAALWLEEQRDDALMLIVPCNQILPDTSAFHDVITAGETAARNGQVVTFGVNTEDMIAKGDYFEFDEEMDSSSTYPINVKKILCRGEVAKTPGLSESRKHLQGTGIFLCSTVTIKKMIAQYAPHIVEAVQLSVSEAKKEQDFIQFDPAAWSSIENVSFAHILSSCVDIVQMIPFRGCWQNIGGWDDVWRASAQPADGVALFGAASAIECRNTMLRSENERLELVGIGLENVIVVAMPDAVLVADIEQVNDVKNAVLALKEKSVEQSDTFPIDHRPWGWFESLVVDDGFQVKRIFVKPGAALSLQSHKHRSEHWIVVKGTAKVTVDDEVKMLEENQSIYIPLGAIHRMENTGQVPLVLIEVQTGSYLGEDDIVRYEDIYSRE